MQNPRVASKMLCQLPRILTRLIVLSAMIAGDCVEGATQVDIVVDEPFESRTVAWPVTTGIPFPRGQLSSEDRCRLLDETGREHPLQSKVAATWDAEGESIRWLTIDFIAEPNREYILEFGDTVRRGKFPSKLQIEKIRHSSDTRISTGVLAVLFSQSGNTSLKRIAADLNVDGRLDDTETVASGGKDGEHYYVDQAGEVASSRGDGDKRRVVVETAGPVRTCVRVDGFYTDTTGRRRVKYRTRYHFFAGLGLMKVVDEFGILQSTKDIRWKDIGFRLNLRLGREDRKVTVDASGEKGNQFASAKWNPTTQSVASYQQVYRHYGNPEYSAGFVSVDHSTRQLLRQPDRMGEWMQVADDRAVVTGCLRWFWQQFPKEWELTEDELAMHFWSPRAGELDFGVDGVKEFFGAGGKKYLLDDPNLAKARQPTASPIAQHFWFGGLPWLERGEADGQGINKHHELFFHFGPVEQAAEAAEYAKLAANQPLALASGEWNCSTGVFGPLSPRPNDSKYEAIVDRIFDLGRYAQDTFGDYGWWVFGSGPHYSYQWDRDAKQHHADPRRFEYHTYQKETQLWWNYLRSGERKFYDWAIPSENHWVDIAVTHVPQTHRSDWYGGEKKRRTLQFRPGDWSIDGPVHYLRHHGTGEAWLRGGSQFWATYHRTLETTTLAYYLTGDERFNDVIQFWTDYWSDLAGKSSDSVDFKSWHREQPWYQLSQQGEPRRTWAEMIRDYAPFNSGSRHQLTLLFNLSTLYEHTWDPKIGQALKEYADAFLDPEHRIGVWRSYDNRLPSRADSPLMAHYWAPALWKYSLATGDPRMKKVLQRYFDASYAADPFREDVGVYSNAHIGYAYYFTRDPRHLRPALRELESLLPNAEPLTDYAAIGPRLYNPYAPIRSFTGVPRLTWALNEAQRNGVPIPPPEPLTPQRTAIAINKKRDEPLKVTLWGYEPTVSLLDPNGKPFRSFEVETRRYSSSIQPFDRTMAGFAVYLHELRIPAERTNGFYLLSPKLETAVLVSNHSAGVFSNAARPVRATEGERWYLVIPERASRLELESAKPANLHLYDPAGATITKTIQDNVASFDLRRADITRVEVRGRDDTWFRIKNWPEEDCWVGRRTPQVQSRPDRRATLAALPEKEKVDLAERFVTGRFGKALQIVDKREFRFTDRFPLDGKEVPLADIKQGTIEFWVKRLWDDRMVTTRPVHFLTNGVFDAKIPWKIPMGEWAHVAMVWRPFKKDPSQTVLQFYVNGIDLAYYRSIWWEGYGSKPFRLTTSAEKSIGEFVAKTVADAPFAIDDLRISSVARYTGPSVAFSHRVATNPFSFTPPDKPLDADGATTVLFQFDGDLNSNSGLTEDSPQGYLEVVKE